MNTEKWIIEWERQLKFHKEMNEEGDFSDWDVYLNGVYKLEQHIAMARERLSLSEQPFLCKINEQITKEVKQVSAWMPIFEIVLEMVSIVKQEEHVEIKEFILSLLDTTGLYHIQLATIKNNQPWFSISFCYKYLPK